MRRNRSQGKMWMGKYKCCLLLCILPQTYPIDNRANFNVCNSNNFNNHNAMEEN